MRDQFQRDINYMRISITDRCNLRCRYCMPTGIELLPMDRILRYEEIEMVVRQAVTLGITRIKITGGEPLVRIDCAKLIRQLKKIQGIEQVTMTSNGVLLGKYLDDLLEAKLDAINISLDSLDRERYRQITGFDYLDKVLDNIDQAIEKGLKVKINAVLQKEDYKDTMMDLVELAKYKKMDIRFIELMPIGFGDEKKGVSNQDVLQTIQNRYPAISPENSFHGNGPAIYYRIPGFQGDIGLISAMYGKFCDKCNRIRMTAQGYIKPCLCFSEGIDLFDLLRSDAKDKESLIQEKLKKAISMKPNGHIFEEKKRISEKKNMIQIGG